MLPVTALSVASGFHAAVVGEGVSLTHLSELIRDPRGGASVVATVDERPRPGSVSSIRVVDEGAAPSGGPGLVVNRWFGLVPRRDAQLQAVQRPVTEHGEETVGRDPRTRRRRTIVVIEEGDRPHPVALVGIFARDTEADGHHPGLRRHLEVRAASNVR
jgi:hypothetical protein